MQILYWIELVTNVDLFAASFIYLRFRLRQQQDDCCIIDLFVDFHVYHIIKLLFYIGYKLDTSNCLLYDPLSVARQILDTCLWVFLICSSSLVLLRNNLLNIRQSNAAELNEILCATSS